MKSNDSPMGEPTSTTEQSLKLSAQHSSNVKAEFNPGQKDKYPCVSPNDPQKAISYISVQYYEKWRRAAFAVTAASLTLSLILAALAFFSTAEYSSSSVLASACDTLLAVVGSGVVLWRFQDVKNDCEKAVQRESIGSVIFGAAFVFNGAMTIAVAVYHLVSEDHVTGTSILVALLSAAFCIYTVLATAEFYISRKLRSSVLTALCVDDSLTACLHLGLLIGKVIYERIPSLWYFDHFSAIGLSFIIVCCGIKILVDVLIFKGLPFQNLFS